LKGTSLDQERNAELTERWKALFKDVDVNDVIGFFCEEEGSLIKENNCGLMLPGTKTECDTQRLNWAMSFARIT
jgi:hypothetical protein